MKTVKNYIKKNKLPAPSDSEEEALEKIFALEKAIAITHRTPGGHGFTVDTLVIIRREYIELFNINYEKYIETDYY